MEVNRTQISEQMQRFGPEPASRLRNYFNNFADQLLKAGKGVAGNLLEGTGYEVSNDYQELLNKQLELQRELLNVSLVSNLTRTEHETKMAPVRNTRVA